MGHPPLIASFVVRLMDEGADEGMEAPSWRVTVRHVQTGKELRFMRLSDAFAFMENCAQALPEAITPKE